MGQADDQHSGTGQERGRRVTDRPSSWQLPATLGIALPRRDPPVSRRERTQTVDRNRTHSNQLHPTRSAGR